MTCTNSTVSLGDPKDRIFRLFFSSVVLVIVVFSNILLVYRLANLRVVKWSAVRYIFKVLACLGLISGLLNNVLYIVNTLTGHWIFGNVLCQSYGVASAVLTTAWLDLLVVAAFERYMKLLVCDEHSSYFSDVNTKIIICGTVLLLVVLHLGPVYGWGEYSPYRGDLDITLTLPFETSSISPNVVDTGLSNMLTSTAHYMAQLQSQLYSGNHPLVGLLTEQKHLNMRGPVHFVQNSWILLSVRMPNMAIFQQFLDDYSSGCLMTEISETFRTNVSQNIVVIDSSNTILLHVDKESLSTYQSSSRYYQDATMCGLDYTPVNNNVYSFVGFSWLCTLLIPAALGGYFYISIYREGLENLCVLSVDQQAPSSDAHDTRVLTFSTIVSAVLILPIYFVNLLAGVGCGIPYAVHVTAILLSYLAPSSVALIYLLSGGSCTETLGAHCTGSVNIPLLNSHRKQSQSQQARNESERRGLFRSFILPKMQHKNNMPSTSKSASFGGKSSTAAAAHDPERGSYTAVSTSSDVDETLL